MQSQNILDHMSCTEIATIFFCATQTQEKLKRDNVKCKQNANKIHFEVSKKVRQTIEELGGNMTGDLLVIDTVKRSRY